MKTQIHTEKTIPQSSEKRLEEYYKKSIIALISRTHKIEKLDAVHRLIKIYLG